MGTRGPKRTPTAVLKAAGSWRAKSRKNEPTPPPGRVRCPAYLGAGAKRNWRRLAERLIKMGVLTPVDVSALARYCQLFARWKEAEQMNDVEMSVKISAHLLRLEHEFGMTPSARAGLATMESDPRENRGKANDRWIRGAG